MSAFTRILSDVHYGDRVSGVRTLPPLRPLLDGPDGVVLNGDTLDTRPSDRPAATAAILEEVTKFFPAHTPAVAYLTGNHDATGLSTRHHLDLAQGRVFAVHGDILFSNIVPWSQDAPRIGRLLRAEREKAPPAVWADLDGRMEIFRRVAGAMPQRHQVEPNPWRYALQFAADTIWPPTRGWSILQAWAQAPRLAADFLRHHRPRARVILTGHTHRPGIWPQRDGVIAINTGSFCPPLGGLAVDLHPEKILVRRIVPRGGEFFPGEVLRDIPLAGP